VTTNRRRMSLSPAAVWGVLADASSFSAWLADVVEVREADPEWPSAGSTCRLRYRWGPFVLSGSARVAESHPPGHLRLRMRRRPLSMSTLEFRLRSTEDGSEVELRESRDVMQAPLVFNHLVDGYAQARDRVSLADLERTAARRARQGRAARVVR
jgi:Polyketide cyclase / dehydrase and lipid transport